ncbi:MAG: hypothetical protein U0232_16840 [Thermomicrobiales bacterium]
MPIARLVRSSLLLTLLLCGPGLTPGRAAAQAEACFAETGYCIRGSFLTYWIANGGLARNGFPLSAERRELLEDGHEYTVQYFERVRLELHPENAPPYDVLLGHFGRRMLPRYSILVRIDVATAPVDPRPGYTYFPETGHNVAPRFMTYWLANGGLAQFGYPIAEEFARVPLVEEGTGRELAPDGTVQYFERARLEYHPENAGTPYEILLGQFGRTILAEVEQLRAQPDFFALYTTNQPLREQLGPPADPPQGLVDRTSGSTQPFERGRMLFLERGMGPYFTDAPPPRAIYALCGEPGAGRWLQFADTWSPGQPEGGGPGPSPGLYEPRFGFYKVWSTFAEVRACLGYATSPDEEPLSMETQRFQRGLLVLVAGAEGRFVYALTYRTYSNGASVVPGSERYERFPIASR